MNVGQSIFSFVIPPLKGGKGVLLLLVLLLSFSCSTPEYLSEKDLQSYILDEANGVAKVAEAGRLQMKVVYRPTDFLVWQELEDEKDLNKGTEVFNRYKDYSYFIMQLKVGERDALYGSSIDQQVFSDRLQTLSFRMNQHVNVTTAAQDTIPVADFYFGRTFGLGKSSDVLFAFNNEKMNGVEWIAFNVGEFGFGTGNRTFRFQSADLNAVPRLKELTPFYLNQSNVN